MKALALLSALLLASCAGYQLGPAKPSVLAGVKSIAVPMVKNNTLHPRAEALATSAITSAVTTDGTYRITSEANADAVLEATISTIDYTPIRSVRFDTLRPEELNSIVHVRWRLVDPRQPGKILLAGEATGTSQLFVDRDLQTARNNALPDAFERASVQIVSALANGF